MNKVCTHQTRPSWEQHFMAHALLAAKRSTCVRIQTGSVLVRDHRIIGEGYNGVVSGAPHCCDHWRQFAHDREYPKESFEDFLNSEAFSELHHEWATDNELITWPMQTRNQNQQC